MLKLSCIHYFSHVVALQKNENALNNICFRVQKTHKCRRSLLPASLKHKVKKISVLNDNGTIANGRQKFNELLLSGDIEINPGPTVANRTKTIVAPYSQSNTEVFG